jgi:hypothetical protein
MKLFLLSLSVMFAAITAKAQPLIIEGLAGDRYLFYQHLIAKNFSPESPFGVMHIANVSSFYTPNKNKDAKAPEVMNQAYLTAKLNKSFTLLTGIFYSNATGIRVAAGLQYAVPFKNGLWITVPRVDIMNQGSAEMMSMLELQPAIKEHAKLYFRIQAMSNVGPYQHNRSYQRVRLGLTIKGTQVGVGMNIDEYGRQSKVHVNTGIFLRKNII